MLSTTYEQALPITEEVGDRAGLGTTLHNIGTVYHALGQRQEALDYYERALPILEEVGDRYIQSITRNNMAVIYHAQGRLAEAIEQLQRAVELAEFVPSPDLGEIRATLAQVEAELRGQAG